MGTTARDLLKAAYAAYGAALVLAAAPANANINVADSPLFLTVGVAPNVVVTLDDSGSMARAYVPDRCGATTNDCATLDTRYMRSSYYNPLYYNPEVKYPAAKNYDGTDKTTSFTAAHRNGFDPGGTLGTRNLSNAYRPTAYVDLPFGGTASEGYSNHVAADLSCNNATTPRMCRIGPGTDGVGTQACTGNNNTARDNNCKTQTTVDKFPAYYYVFNSANAGCTTVVADRPTDDDCYSVQVVTATSGPGTIDLNGDGALTVADKDERQNFANWFSFARTRNLSTQTAASLAFVTLDPDVRLAWQALNTCKGDNTNFVADCDGWKNNFNNMSNAIRPFTGTQKANFYAWLSQLPTQNSTPLPAAMKRVGEYYKRSGENNPYDNNFNTTNSGELSCRRNYHVMMTDGIWNGSNSGAGNRDNTATTLPATVSEQTSYTPITPYRDAHSNTLADLAFQYWITDLRTTMSNNLLGTYRDNKGTPAQNFANPRNDPATWQHMVNFTIGLGLTDYLAQEGLVWDKKVGMYGGSYTSLSSGVTLWPQPAADDPANVADLWHAALNSRGQFFSADDPASLSVAFRAALDAIGDDSGSSAALSANSTSLTGDTLVYQARFNPDWSGSLRALPIDKTGKVGAPAWDASTLIPKPDDRKMFTHDGTQGIEFKSCSALSLTQRLWLNTNSGGTQDANCAARLQWLRGNHKDEQASTTTGSLKLFRNRTTVMGDIVNSDPAYVKDVNYSYEGLPSGTPGQDSYINYRNDNASRTAMVYVGANDGHLYGIRGDSGESDSGVEKFSYIPAGVFHNLRHLTDPSYAHRYYVDGSITVRDAYINNDWRTVLVAGLNAGGRSIYALDVTDPENFSEKNVLWEFNSVVGQLDASDASDMGLTYSRPQIGVLESGDWVAIFGNGYNSPDGGAHLFIVDLATGKLLRKLTAADADLVDDANGMSTPLLYDADNNRKIDAAYAGDLQGNLWKFDLSGTNSSAWNVVNDRPLFTAEISGVPQPITSQPRVTAHHVSGYVVLFGTGRYLTKSDVFDQSVQSYYGIWDDLKSTDTADRGDLVQQWFKMQGNGFNRGVRSVTDNTIDWEGGKRGWYVDLLNGAGQSASGIGERVVSTSNVLPGRVLFTTIVPSNDPCKPGGESWLFALPLTTGGAFSNSVLDLNNDGKFSSSDTLTPDDENPEVINAITLPALGISNVSVMIDVNQGDAANPDMALAVNTGTGDGGGFSSTLVCTEANTADCEEKKPTDPPGVRRRSWIQIR